GEYTGACQRCGSLNLRYADDKYCQSCMRLIGRFQNARRQQQQQEAEVLTTTSPRIVEERHVPVPAAPEPVQQWRITAKRVIIDTIIVEGTTVIDALAAFESQVPDAQITDVHLLDG